MKMIVTGGAGFIGSHLADRLAENHRVVIVDDLTTGRTENITHLLKKENVTFVRGSILDLGLLRQHFVGAEYVFHQAALPSVPRSIDDPLTTNDVNIRGTLNVLLASRDSHVKKVVCASSSSVYGDTAELPKKESMIPNPQSPYALTKMVGEYYCRIFSQIYNLPTVSLRYFNVYGPRQTADSAYSAVIPSFVSRLKQGLPPIIYGDGSQTRDFTYVQDVVTANILAAEYAPNGVYNIGAEHPISILELALTIARVLDKEITPVFQAPRLGDVKDSFANIHEAGLFGYNPRFNLQEGLKETIRGTTCKTD